MILRDRGLWIGAGAVAYVAFAALRAREGRGPAWAALALLPPLLVAAWTYAARIREDAARRGQTPPDGAFRVAFTGGAMVLAARSGPSGPGFVAAANLGAALAASGALFALARLPRLPGLLDAPKTARSLDAAVLAVALWTVAIALPAARAVAPGRFALLDPLAIDYATVAASIGSLGVLVVAALRARTARRLELDVGERAHASALFALTALSIGIGAALLEVAPPEVALPLALAASSVLSAWASVAREGARVSRVLRTTLGVSALAAPLAFLGTFLAHTMPERAGGILFLTGAACAVAGLFAPRAAALFAPRAARWLAAFRAATEAAMTPDPDAALEAALGCLERAAGGRKGAGLYQLTPPEFVHVDRAGYVHREIAPVPPEVLTLAEAEPLGILRAPVLRAIEVRRPDVRAAAAWMERRGALAVALVRDAMGPIGLVAVPSEGARAPMTLEEARALRALSDRLGAAIGVSFSLARSRDRELSMRGEVERLGSMLEAATREGEGRGGRLEAWLRAADARLRRAAFSPAMRSTIEAIERAAASGRSVVLLEPVGGDRLGYVALAHLASGRDPDALALVDGTRPGDASLEVLRDPERSPLARAKGGTVALLDPQALPAESQRLLAASGAPFVALMPAPPGALAASGRLDAALAARLGDGAISLPTIADRAEDLRALSLAFLADLGVRLRGAPYGLSLPALARLGDHPFPGNEAELESLLLRAALVARGDVLTPEDLAKAGLPSLEAPALPAPRRRRSKPAAR